MKMNETPNGVVNPNPLKWEADRCEEQWPEMVGCWKSKILKAMGVSPIK